MRSTLGLASTIVWLLAAWPAGAGDIWTFDRQHTEVRFSWDHLGVARQSGEFLELRGELEFSPTEPERAAVDVTIRAASLSTGVRELDTHLKSADFFDVARYPEITFKSTTIRPTGERMGEIDGILIIMGIAKPVTLKTRWNFSGEHPLAAINPVYKGKWVSGFSAETVIRRSEWGLTRALPLVSDEIRVEIEAEFLRREAP